MRATEAAARARRAVGSVLPVFLRSFFAKMLVAVGAPRWALPEWEYVPEGWTRALADRRVTGWQDPHVAAVYRTKRTEVLAALRGPGPLAFPTSSFEPTSQRSVRDHNTIVSFAYVLALAAGGRGRLSLLDWGGGIGVHCHLGKALIPELELDYHVKEVAPVCALGREIEPAVTFHEDESCFKRQYDVVMASSSLQYEERWQKTLAKLVTAASRYVFLTRVPVVLHAPSHVVRHRTSIYGREAEYLSWVVNRDELVACAERAGAMLAREFLIGLSRPTLGAPERREIRAFLFRRTSAE
jgi:putative methyltransferase (TIGR04325 family)